jgi:hypothetical protein
LPDAPDHLRIESRAAYASGTLARPLRDALLEPEALFPDDDREIKEFKLTLTRVPGLNRDSGNGSFAESVVELTKEFYAQVLQPLRPWKEAAPKLQRRTSETAEVEELVVETDPAIAAAFREAKSEVAPLDDEAVGSTDHVPKND